MTDITPIAPIAPISMAPPVAMLAAESELNPYTRSFKSMDEHMLFLADRASKYYKNLDSKNQIAKEGQKYLQEVNEKIESFRGGSGSVSHEAKDFFTKYLSGCSPSYSNLEDLQKIQSSLDGFVSSQVDFVSESQLQVQRMMQSYNTAVTFMNSLQTSLAEMFKTIIQGIR